MNNLTNSSLLHTYRKSYCIFLITILSFFTLQAQQKELDSGKKYTINEIKVTGAQNFNEQTVIAFTGLKPQGTYETASAITSLKFNLA